MTFEEAILYFRVLSDDFETTDENGNIIPPEYSDDRIAILLAAGIKQAQVALRVPQKCRIDVKLTPPHIIPEDLEICDDFWEVVLLKSLCSIQKFNIEGQFGGMAMTAQLGPARLQVQNSQWSNMPKYIWDSTSPCMEYQKKITELLVSNPNGISAVYSMISLGRCGTGYLPRSQEFSYVRDDMVQ